ncbi:hypothetical protein ACQKMD_06670 [Viridibacillus sp. NPDC096237]
MASIMLLLAIAVFMYIRTKSTKGKSISASKNSQSLWYNDT